MVRIGILGVGHLGKIHLNCIRRIPELDVVGFYDPDNACALEVIETYNLKRYDSLAELFANCDAVDVVAPTAEHAELALQAVEAGKHVFIEKPVTQTLVEADELVRACAKRPQLKVQVGHVERFNPALLAIRHVDLQPMFIEGHRLSQFQTRGTDVSVVLDLMIHDLDLVMYMVPHPIVSVEANGVAVVSQTPDIANVRLTFANGCVANLTASRISLKKMRKLRIFQPNAYLSLDFLNKNADVLRLLDVVDGSQQAADWMAVDTTQGKKWMQYEQALTVDVNAIEEELRCFARCILDDTEPIVHLNDGVKALSLAHRILDIIGSGQPTTILKDS